MNVPSGQFYLEPHFLTLSHPVHLLQRYLSSFAPFVLDSSRLSYSTKSVNTRLRPAHMTLPRPAPKEGAGRGRAHVSVPQARSQRGLRQLDEPAPGIRQDISLRLGDEPELQVLLHLIEPTHGVDVRIPLLQNGIRRSILD